MRLSLLLILTLWSPFLVAQTPTSSCACSKVLFQVSQEAADNYAGWADKVTATTRPVYQHLLDSLQTRAASTTTNTGCLSLLKAYKAFFRDGHFSARPTQYDYGIANHHPADQLDGSPGAAVAEPGQEILPTGHWKEFGRRPNIATNGQSLQIPNELTRWWVLC